ncbi:MAG: VanZ family protein [Adlercreutzia sp.]|nr:VanZ family protein [Adlercreutzia sp.]
MTKRTKLILSWVVVVLWAAFIFFMSAHTGADLDDGTGLVADLKRWLVSLATPLFGPDTDIVSVAAHFTEYLVFGVLLFHALWRTAPKQRWWLLAIAAVAIASLYGVTDEFHQSFVPGRLCDPADWLTDTLGASVGALAAWVVSRRAARRMP